MILVFISDTHGMHDQITKVISKIENIDVLVHAGDVSNRGYSWEIERFLQWFDVQPAKRKVFIAGNHDWAFQDQPTLMKEILSNFPNVNYLENSEVIIDGIKFYGSPITPTFFNWAFNVDRGDKIREHWLQIPLDTDVLITHGPPHGILDKVVRDRKHVGCEDLMDVITSQVNPKIHAFGHIHEGFGTHTTEQTIYVNASSVSLYYHPCNHPVRLELEKDLSL